jgi:hypothetical protein
VVVVAHLLLRDGEGLGRALPLLAQLLDALFDLRGLACSVRKCEGKGKESVCVCE